MGKAAGAKYRAVELALCRLEDRERTALICQVARAVCGPETENLARELMSFDGVGLQTAREILFALGMVVIKYER